MKKILFTVLMTFCFLSKAQMWCPPGATWHYFINYNTPAAYKSGVEELTYTGTVTVNTIVCKRIVNVFTGVMPFSSSPVNTYTILDIKTYENNQVLYVYDQNSNLFDTLVNFNASIGDKWRTPAFTSPTSTCQLFQRPIVTVLDTGHVFLNSLYLKKIVVHNSFFGYNDTIIEKLAGFNQFLSPYYVCATDWAPHGKLICYEDNSFTLYKKPPFTICTYDPTNIKENDLDGELKFYPDPVGAVLNIVSKNGLPIEVKIFDLAGREVLVSTTKNQIANSVDVEKLTKGIYFIRLYSSGQFLGIKKIIKE